MKATPDKGDIAVTAGCNMVGVASSMFVPESATISEAAALLCRGLEAGLEDREGRLSRGGSQDLLQDARQDPGSAGQDEDTSSSPSSTATAAAAATLSQWEDWFTLARYRLTCSS